MADVIASWLESRPTDSAQSLVQGLQLGAQFREIRDRRAQFQQQFSLEQQKLAASERQAAMDNQIRRETILSNFQRAQTQTALTKAYHDSQLGLAKSKLDLEAQKFQRTTQEQAATIADTVGYAHAVASGTPALKAREQFPRAKLPAQEEKATKPVMSDYSKAMHKSLADAYTAALKTGDMLSVGAAAKQLREFDEKQNPEGLVQPQGTPEAQPATPAASFQAAQTPEPRPQTPNPTPRFTDKSGNVYAYKGSSDDPTSDKNPDNWQLINQ